MLTGCEPYTSSSDVDSDYERELQRAKAVGDTDMVTALLDSLCIQTEHDLDMAEAVKASLLQQQPTDIDAELAEAIQASLILSKAEGKKAMRQQESLQVPAAQVSVGSTAGSSGISSSAAVSGSAGSSGVAAQASGSSHMALLQVAWPVLAETVQRMLRAMVSGQRSNELLQMWLDLNDAVVAARLLQPLSPALSWALDVTQDAIGVLFCEHGAE